MWILGKPLGMYDKVLASATADMWKNCIVNDCNYVVTSSVLLWIYESCSCLCFDFSEYAWFRHSHCSSVSCKTALMLLKWWLEPFSTHCCPMHLSLGTGSDIYGMALGTGLGMTKKWEE